jgi:hypothetical protein
MQILLISLILLLAAAAMTVWHVHAWRTMQRRETDAEELDYRRRQYRRRVQTDALFGLMAVVLGAACPLLAWINSAWFALAYWGMGMLVVGWIMWLALVDMRATQRHFRQQLQRDAEETARKEAEFQAEVRRIQADKSKKT